MPIAHQQGVEEYLDKIVKNILWHLAPSEYIRSTLAFFVSLTMANNQDERIAKMIFASVYPHYRTKIEKKGRTEEELNEVIAWLTGYDTKKQRELIEERVTFETFFKNASLNPNARLITGVICGYRVEEIENTLTRQVRYLDKLVDELARGRKMEKIMRVA